jgi:hypothetical protein
VNRRRAAEPLSVHPATAAADLARFVEVSGFALLAIRQALELDEALDARSVPAAVRINDLRDKIAAELAKVSALLPE